MEPISIIDFADKGILSPTPGSQSYLGPRSSGQGGGTWSRCWWMLEDWRSSDGSSGWRRKCTVCGSTCQSAHANPPWHDRYQCCCHPWGLAHHIPTLALRGWVVFFFLALTLHCCGLSNFFAIFIKGDVLAIDSQVGELYCSFFGIFHFILFHFIIYLYLLYCTVI